MMQRRIAPAALAAVLALFALTGCSGALDTGTGTNGGGAEGAPEAIGSDGIPRPDSCDDENPYLAVALPNLTNPYYVAMQKGFEEEGAAQGFDVEVQIADDDDAQQLSQVQAMLQKDPCALALNAVKSDPAAAIVKAANEAGVPVFTVNVTVAAAALEAQGATIVQYLGADNYAGGAQMAEAVLADLGDDAEMKIGFVSEPDEVPVVERDRGFEETIAANANAEVVAKVDGNVKPDDSLRVTTEMMSGNPDINVIFASTGPATYGALQAIGDSEDVKIYGFCAAEETLTGPYAGCVAQEPESYGRQVVEQITGWLDGGTPEEEILLSLKLFEAGETPAPGEVG